MKIMNIQLESLTTTKKHQIHLKIKNIETRKNLFAFASLNSLIAPKGVSSCIYHHTPEITKIPKGVTKIPKGVMRK